MIEFPLTQDIYNEWYSAKLARVADPEDEYMMADAMDCNNILALSVALLRTHPDKQDLIYKHAPNIIERAGGELGTFLGAGELGKAIGEEPERMRQLMMSILMEGDLADQDRSRNTGR